MARIVQRRDRHFMDDRGRLYWINGPEEHCYLSEQRQWRRGLSFDQVLTWKQCAPSGLVSQRFASVAEACEAFEHGLIQWSQDLYLRRMGDQMAQHRGADDYVPTALQKADAVRGLPPRRPPWCLPEPEGPCCGLPPRASVASGLEMAHPHRRRRSTPAAH